MNRKSNKVLVCPLNWGLGHASRCVPIIRQLLGEGYEPVLVADGFPLQFLRQEFPFLSYIEFSSYSVSYSKGKSQVWAMLRCVPGIIRRIIAEHQWLKRLLSAENYCMVISDNRFGLWNKSVKSVYITHQLMVKMPQGLKFLEPFAHFLHARFIARYDECWIPDYEGADNLSGDLSHKYPLPANARFIGPLSRFSDYKDAVPDNTFHTLVVVSGVEPQRSVFEHDLISRFQKAPQKTLIVQGMPQQEKQVRQQGNITIVSHLTTSEMASALLGAKHIISRSGYSTIMDLASLSCLHKAELIPTPGQTEQEYLAIDK